MLKAGIAHEKVDLCPGAECIHRIFERQAAQTPSSPALSTQTETWSYAQLNEFANRVANRLKGASVGAGSLVGLALPRSLKCIAVLLGILKTGAAYVPFDANYPEERLRFMVEDTDIPCLISERSGSGNFSALLDRTRQLIHIDEFDEESAEFVSEPSDGGDLAYVMYTSGSTGVPKGVMVTHRGIVRLACNPDYMNIGPDDVFLQLAPLSFDASTLEIWAPLLNGAKVVVPPPEMNGLADIADSLTRHHVTSLWLTSGLFNAVVDEFPNALRNLKQLLAGGDVLSPVHVRRAMEAMESGCVINGYGPTENTTFTCCHRITEEDTHRASIPIGRPIRGTEVYILDEQMRPVSGGQVGEIYIGGDGLARGYLNRPELTAERFVRNPFSPDASSRLYKSGDLAHYNAQGDIEFDGRTDLQVKIRGFRIEPREIESVVHSIPGIADCAVVVKDANSEAKRLVCFFAKKNEEGPRATALEQTVKEKLPAYMVPSAFVELERLPLNPNGKVDRRWLSDYHPERGSVVVAESTGAVEREVAAIFSALFDVDPVGAEDDFFELGGNSLMAARLFAKIERQFGRKLPLATVLKARTPRRLASVIAGDGWQPSWSPLVPLKTGGVLPPLFLVHAIGGNVVGYQDLVPYWPADQPLYALQARGLDAQTRPAATVEEMAADYLEAIRLAQPHGPYYLGGYSAGGVVAFAMACKLQEAGFDVGKLILIDSSIEGPVRNRLRSRPVGGECLRVSRTVRWNLAYMQRIGMRDFLSVKRRNLGMNVNIASQKLRRALPFALRQSTTPSLNVEESFILALRNYVPGRFRGRAALLRTEDAEFYSPDESLGWRDVIDGTVSVHRIPGNHDNILSGPQVKILAEGILSEMDEAGGEAKVKIKSARPV